MSDYDETRTEEFEDGGAIVTRTTVTTTRTTGGSGDELFDDSEYGGQPVGDMKRSDSSSSSDRDTAKPTAGGKKLSGSKFSKFEKPSDENNETGNKAKASKRLDTSRFAKFNQNQDASQKKPILPNYRKRDVKKTMPMQQEKPSNENNCHTCGKRVYPMEKLAADRLIFHKICFKCSVCKTTLRVGSFSALNNKMYCKAHFTQLFKLKGNYKDGFADATPAPKAAVNSDKEEFEVYIVEDDDDTDIPQFDDELTTTDYEGQLVTDSPQFDDELTASNYEGQLVTDTSDTQQIDDLTATDYDSPTDQLSEDMTHRASNNDTKYNHEVENVEEYTGLRSIKDKLEGEKEKVEIKKNGFGAEERLESGQVAENEPLLRSDVAREDMEKEEPRMLYGGMKSARDRFESQEANESEVKKSYKDYQNEIKQLTARNDYEEEEGPAQIFESKPEVRDDVARESDKPTPTPGLTGGLKSLKDRFEKGEVQTTRTTPKPIEIPRAEPPAEVDDEEDGRSSPEQKEEIRPPFGVAKSLRARWESGQVSNAEKKERTKIDIPTRLTDDEEEVSSTGEVVENNPTPRDDVIRESDQKEEVFSSNTRKLRSMWETGEVQTSQRPVKPKIEIPVRSLEDDDEEDSGHIAENQPVRRDDVVRSDDTPSENIVFSSARSLKDRWEKGEVESVANIQKEKVEIPVRDSDDYESEGDQVYESKPVQRDDVVRESDEVRGAVLSTNAKSLRDKWERGDVDHIEIKKERIEIPHSSDENYEGDESGQMSENEPEYRPDLARESDSSDSTPVTASAKSLKDRWEAGDVTHAEFKSEKIEMTPKLLEDYEGYVDDGQTTENEPTQREDLARETVESPEPVKLSVSASAMRNKWEAGEIEHADFQSEKIQLQPKSFIHGDDSNDEEEETANDYAEEVVEQEKVVPSSSDEEEADKRLSVELNVSDDRDESSPELSVSPQKDSKVDEFEDFYQFSSRQPEPSNEDEDSSPLSDTAVKNVPVYENVDFMSSPDSEEPSSSPDKAQLLIDWSGDDCGEKQPDESMEGDLLGGEFTITTSNHNETPTTNDLLDL
ncbi:uncharacterized protein LOC144440944 isoform X2 [Glandiceps talaboti]